MTAKSLSPRDYAKSQSDCGPAHDSHFMLTLGGPHGLTLGGPLPPAPPLIPTPPP